MNFVSLLTVLFIGLKLTGYIDWSWWLVLLPAYAGIAIVVVIMGLAVMAGGKLKVTRK